jgi:hypothetical protein
LAEKTQGSIATRNAISPPLNPGRSGLPESFVTLAGIWHVGLKTGLVSVRNRLSADGAEKNRADTCIAATCAAVDGITSPRNQPNALNAESL